jgi:hypothetical protein
MLNVVDDKLWKELMAETLQDHQKDMQKLGRSELKEAVKRQKEWNKSLKEFTKMEETSVKHLEKGFQELNKVGQEGLAEVGEGFESLTQTMRTAAPAIQMLKQQFVTQTMDSQMELMNSLLQLVQSEGVQGVMRFLSNMFNAFATGTVDMVKFATRLSDFLGTNLGSKVDFSPFRTALKSLNETRTDIFESVASIVKQIIEKIAQYPSVFKLLENLIQGMTGILKGIETQLETFDTVLTSIDKTTRNLLSKWGIFLDMPITGVGTYEDYGLDLHEWGVEFQDENENGIPDYEEDQIIPPKPDADIAGDLLRPPEA